MDTKRLVVAAVAMVVALLGEWEAGTFMLEFAMFIGWPPGRVYGRSVNESEDAAARFLDLSPQAQQEFVQSLVGLFRRTAEVVEERQRRENARVAEAMMQLFKQLRPQLLELEREQRSGQGDTDTGPLTPVGKAVTLQWDVEADENRASNDLWLAAATSLTSAVTVSIGLAGRSGFDEQLVTDLQNLQELLLFWLAYLIGRRT